MTFDPDVLISSHTPGTFRLRQFVALLVHINELDDARITGETSVFEMRALHRRLTAKGNG
jgi:hypothetical protein